MKLRTKGFMLKKPDKITLNALQNFKIDHTERLIDVSDEILNKVCDIEKDALKVMRERYKYYLQYIIE